MLEQEKLGNSESRDASTKQWVEYTFSQLNRVVSEQKEIEGENEKNLARERKGIQENITDIESQKVVGDEKEKSVNINLQDDEEIELHTPKCLQIVLVQLITTLMVI